jgi:hypothetical protein
MAAGPIQSTDMKDDRAALFFRVQSTLFCVFYSALLFLSIIYFRHRIAFITEALGAESVLPGLLRVARALHHPVILMFSMLAPAAVVVFVWVTRPNALALWFQGTLMLLLVLLAFIPPVATEITTSTTLDVIHRGARERGLIK